MRVENYGVGSFGERVAIAELRDSIVVPPGRVAIGRDHGMGRVFARTRGFGAVSGTTVGAVAALALGADLLLAGVGWVVGPLGVFTALGGALGAFGWWRTERMELVIEPQRIRRVGPVGREKTEWAVSRSSEFTLQEVLHPIDGSRVGFRIVLLDPEGAHAVGLFFVEQPAAERFVAELRRVLDDARDARGYRE